MKVFITLAVVCLFAGALSIEISEENKAKAKAHFQECIKQENVSEEDAAKLRNKDFSGLSPSAKCFAACFFEKVGVLKDNKIQEEVAKEKLALIIGEEKTKDVLSKCKDIKGAERCETGHELFKCVESLKAQLLA